jgi:hypothetical protein
MICAVTECCWGVKLPCLRGARCVVRLWETKDAYRILLGNPEEESPPGRLGYLPFRILGIVSLPCSSAHWLKFGSFLEHGVM